MSWMFKTRWCAGFVALLCAAQLHATVFEVTVTTSSPLTGTDATLAFDLLSGDAPMSSLTISDFSSAGGSLGDAFFIHDFDVTSAPTLAGTVTLEESGLFFNEYQQRLTFGTSFTFRFFTSGTQPASGTPDAFSFYLLDAEGVQPLLLTGDVNAPQTVFFSADIGSVGAPQPLPILSPEGVTIQVSEAVTAAPEPGVAMLLAGGLLAMAYARRRTPRTDC